MAQPDFSKWEPMSTAPRDGTLVLAAIRATEQGPAEVDAVRWAKSARTSEEGWVANDSDPFARIIYAEPELTCWSPLPTQMPNLRSAPTEPRPARTPDNDEMDGSAI